MKYLSVFNRVPPLKLIYLNTAGAPESFFLSARTCRQQRYLKCSKIDARISQVIRSASSSSSCQSAALSTKDAFNSFLRATRIPALLTHASFPLLLSSFSSKAHPSSFVLQRRGLPFMSFCTSSRKQSSSFNALIFCHFPTSSAACARREGLKPQPLFHTPDILDPNLELHFNPLYSFLRFFFFKFHANVLTMMFIGCDSDVILEHNIRL